MDEKLQQELLMILRELRTGTPEALQVLVDAHVSYCLAIGWSCVAGAVFGVAFVVAGAFGMAKSNAAKKKGQDLLECLVGIPSGVGIAVGSIAFCVCAFHGITHFAEAAAPLGRVLEMLR